MSRPEEFLASPGCWSVRYGAVITEHRELQLILFSSRDTVLESVRWLLGGGQTSNYANLTLESHIQCHRFYVFIQNIISSGGMATRLPQYIISFQSEHFSVLWSVLGVITHILTCSKDFLNYIFSNL